jgi:hypothetical protein
LSALDYLQQGGASTTLILWLRPRLQRPRSRQDGGACQRRPAAARDRESASCR